MPTPGTNVARSSPLRSSIAGVSWNRRSTTSAVTRDHFVGQTSSRFSTMRRPAAYCSSMPGLIDVLGDAAVPLAQRDPQLATREVRAEAPVHAAAEREVTVDVAVEAHLHRVGVLGGVDVGRTHVDEHERIPAGIGVAGDRASPVVAMRGTFGTGVSQRSSSSTALGMSSGLLDDLAAVVGVLGEEREEAR